MSKRRLIERQHLGTLVDDMHAFGPQAPAVVEHQGVRRFATSYGELAALARRFAAELDRRGVAPGERVLLWGAGAGGAAFGTAHWIAAYFGCVLRGVLPAPLDATGSAAFAERIEREIAPRLVVGDGALLSRARFSAPALLLDELRMRLPTKGVQASLPALGPDSPLQILFTSGTTGEPKGVVHTHRNLMASLGPIEREIARYRRYERWVHPLRFLHTLPLSHVFGQFMGLWVPPLLGATVHYESRGTASHLLELLPREKIHVLAAVPRSLALLRGQLLVQFPGLAQEISAAQGERLGRRWWRFRRVHRALGVRFLAAVCGGATLPAELEQFWTTMGFALVQGYGLTETAALVTLNHPFKTARGSLGAPLPGRELRLGATGELEVKGDMVSTASWQDGAMVERESPWLPTGDLAALEPDGRLRFLGRTSQRLVTAAGLNVYLQDMEQALEQQPELGDALVLPWPDGGGGEEPAAVVTAGGGIDAARAAMVRANGALAAHQQVRRWWLWPGLRLPRTATGKVQRAAVESWARQQATDNGQNQLDGSDRPDPAVALLETVAARQGPRTDAARLDEDWGLDSMGRVALTAALEEQLGLALSEAAATRLETLGDLRALLRGGAAAENTQSGDAGAGDTFPSGMNAGHADAGAQREADPAAATTAARGLTAPPALPFRYPRWPWSLPVRAVRFLFTELLLRPLVALLGAPRIIRSAARFPAGAGEQAIERQPCLLIGNHRTAMDVPLLLYALPFAVRRRVAVAMSGEMLAGWQGSWSRRRMSVAIEQHRRWWGPPAALLVQALFNVFPLPRNSGFRRSFAHAGRAFDRGYNVLIFPEGRRARDEAMLPFKAGTGILAREAFVPVLPLALSVDSSRRIRPVIHIGQPVAIDRTWEPERLTAALEQLVLNLRRDVRAAE